MKIMLNLDSYPGTSCLSRWNGGLPLISGLSQEKTLNSGMGNSNRVTEIDTVSSHSPYDKLSDSNFHERCTSRQSGDENSNYFAKLDPQSKPTHSVSSTGALFSQTSIDFRQPFVSVQIPCTYAESYSGGMFHSFRSHAMINSNISGFVSPRVPLPQQPSDEELIYVNPKQYNGILRRRQLRAKLEAKRKLTRGRKPYLHESRHLHAMRRVRGSGGRFVNTKQNHQKKAHTSSPRSGNKTTTTTIPSFDIANIFRQNQNNCLDQNNYSSHTSYNSKVSGGYMHH